MQAGIDLWEAAGYLGMSVEPEIRDFADGGDHDW
jgi:hypothetical protein